MKRLTKSQYEAIAEILATRLEAVTSQPEKEFSSYSQGIQHGRYQEMCKIANDLEHLFKKNDAEFDRHKFSKLIGFN